MRWFKRVDMGKLMKEFTRPMTGDELLRREKERIRWQIEQAKEYMKREVRVRTEDKYVSFTVYRTEGVEECVKLMLERDQAFALAEMLIKQANELEAS